MFFNSIFNQYNSFACFYLISIPWFPSILCYWFSLRHYVWHPLNLVLLTLYVSIVLFVISTFWILIVLLHSCNTYMPCRWWKLSIWKGVWCVFVNFCCNPEPLKGKLEILNAGEFSICSNNSRDDSFGVGHHFQTGNLQIEVFISPYLLSYNLHGLIITFYYIRCHFKFTLVWLNNLSN